MSDTVIREVKAGLWLGASHLRAVGVMEEEEEEGRGGQGRGG